MTNSKQHIIFKMILCRRTEHVIKSWLEMPLIHILKNILKNMIYLILVWLTDL